MQVKNDQKLSASEIENNKLGNDHNKQANGTVNPFFSFCVPAWHAYSSKELQYNKTPRDLNYRHASSLSSYRINLAHQA